MIIARNDLIIDKSERARLYNHLSIYTKWIYFEKGSLLSNPWEQLRFMCLLIIASKPVLSCGLPRRTAAEIRIFVSIISKVVFAVHCALRPIKITVKLTNIIRAVHVEVKRFPIGRKSCAVYTRKSPDVYVFEKATLANHIWYGKQISNMWRTNIVSVIYAVGRKITSGSPMSGGIPDGLHAAHRQAVEVPWFRIVLIGVHVVRVEWSIPERAIVVQRVGLDQSPYETRFGTKVAVDWEWDIFFVNNVVCSIGSDVVYHHDFFTRSRQLTSVSREARRTWAGESSFGRIADLIAGAAILTW